MMTVLRNRLRALLLHALHVLQIWFKRGMNRVAFLCRESSITSSEVFI